MPACSGSGTACSGGWEGGAWRASPCCAEREIEELTLILVSAAVAAALPLALLAGRWLQFRRDFLFLAVYLQGWLYVHAGPYLYARGGVPFDLGSYRLFALWALPLFDAALLAGYVTALGRARAWAVFRPP